jgi:hypothetical protein
LTPKEDGDRQFPSPLWKRLGWFVLLWLGGLAAVSLLAFVIRSVLVG